MIWLIVAAAFIGLAWGVFSLFKDPLVNSKYTSRATIIDQMNEPRPLPMGQKEFIEWSDRIISGAQVPCESRESLVKTLAAMLMQLGQTESHKPDAFFIHALRKAAVNEVAHANFQAIKAEQEKRLKERQQEELAKVVDLAAK